MKWLVPILACAACSDPGYICEGTGERIKYDGTCMPGPPTIDIDGDYSDWSALQLPANSCDCGPGEVSFVSTIATASGEVAVYARVDGPLTDANHAYVFSFEPLDGPAYELDFRVSTKGVETFVGSTGMTGITARAVMGPNGIELAVPISALPFTAGAFVGSRLDKYDPVDGWLFGQTFLTHQVPACWDASSPSCRPKQHIWQ